MGFLKDSEIYRLRAVLMLRNLDEKSSDEISQWVARNALSKSVIEERREMITEYLSDNVTEYTISRFEIDSKDQIKTILTDFLLGQIQGIMTESIGASFWDEDGFYEAEEVIMKHEIGNPGPNITRGEDDWMFTLDPETPLLPLEEYVTLPLITLICEQATEDWTPKFLPPEEMQCKVLEKISELREKDGLSVSITSSLSQTSPEDILRERLKQYKDDLSGEDFDSDLGLSLQGKIDLLEDLISLSRSSGEESTLTPG